MPCVVRLWMGPSEDCVSVTTCNLSIWATDRSPLAFSHRARGFPPPHSCASKPLLYICAWPLALSSIWYFVWFQDPPRPSAVAMRRILLPAKFTRVPRL